MAHTKAKGTSSNGRDSQPQYLGVKLFGGQVVKSGNIIVRQHGGKIVAGEGVRTGKDWTLYAVKVGKIAFVTRKKKNFDGSSKIIKVVSVV